MSCSLQFIAMKNYWIEYTTAFRPWVSVAAGMWVLITKSKTNGRLSLVTLCNLSLVLPTGK